MRKLAVFTGSFSLGIFIVQYVLPESISLMAAGLAFMTAVCFLLLPYEWRRRGVVIFSALALAIGYNWAYCRFFQRPMEALEGSKASVTMTLCDYAVRTDYGAKVEVEIEGVPSRAVYYGSERLLDLQPGQRIEDVVEFQSSEMIRDDKITTFTSKNIFLLAYGRDQLVIYPAVDGEIRWLPVRTSRMMREKIHHYFEGDTAAFLSALLTGDRTGLSAQATNDLSETGLTHIMAVSGMHCGFLLSLLMLLIGKHRHKLIILIAVPILVFYALLTGAGPSVIRSCIMLSMMLAASLVYRENDGLTSLLFALFLILVQNPFAVASISLQLSFAATGGLLWLTPKVFKYLTERGFTGKIKLFIASSVASTAGALVFSVPVAAYYFGTLSLVAPISNLLCLGVVSVIFALGILMLLLSFVLPPAAYVLSYAIGGLIQFVLQAAHSLSGLPYHAVYFVNPYLKLWLAFSYVILAFSYFRKRGYGIAVGSVFLALVASIYCGSIKYDGDLEVVVTDAGQGQCVVLASQGSFAVVDCGSRNSWYDPGNNAADLLFTMGCRKLETLVLTHYDSDHINGTADLLARMDVDMLYLPRVPDGDALHDELVALAEQNQTKICYVEESEVYSLGLAELKLLPSGETFTEDNDRGLAVIAALDDQALLITGDMSRSAEKHLLKTYELQDIDALVAGHHGAKGSTSVELLEGITPEIVCISVGSNNYGHPAEETLRRIAERGCAVYRTDLHGNIRISWNEGEEYGKENNEK